MKSLGISIMRVELEPALFSLGINIEIVEREHGSSQNQTVFISACQSLNDLRRYVISESFAAAAMEHFESCIQQNYLSQKEHKDTQEMGTPNGGTEKVL